MGNLYNKREKIKVVPPRDLYPGLKPILKKHGYYYTNIYLRMDGMRPDVFSTIIRGVIPEPKGFLEATLEILKILGIETTEEVLRSKPEKQVNI